jgi:hypothetical protein
MRVINSATRTTVLRELALLRALCASLRDSQRATKLVAKAMPGATTAAAKPLAPTRLPAETADLDLGGPP